MTADTEIQQASTAPEAAPPRRGLRTALLLVMAVALVALGGGGAVVLGIGRQDPPAANSVDAGFAWDMSRHHLQGVEMANLAPGRSQDPVIRSLAFDISATQTNQVGRMQGWLSLWGLSNTSSRPPMEWMDGVVSGHSMDGMDMSTPGALMPGMATEQELDHLRSLSGTAFDVEFLRLMIRHHQGGLKMAQYAEAHAQLAPVRLLARSMAETQTAEVGTMAQLLAERGGTPLPAP
ncbi:MAG: DUF305 domain-containing protein [Catenulispora sp.]